MTTPPRVSVRNAWEPPDAQGGVPVFIDVFRASTTLAWLLAGGPAEVLSAADDATVARCRAEGCAAVSEVLADADFDNSPTRIRAADVRGRRFILKTGNLTAGILANLAAPGTGLVAGFANLSAVARHLERTGAASVDLVACGHFDERAEGLEDRACALMLAARLSGLDERGIPFETMIRSEIDWRRERADRHPPHYFADLELALGVDALAVVPGVAVAGEGIVRYVDLAAGA